MIDPETGPNFESIYLPTNQILTPSDTELSGKISIEVGIGEEGIAVDEITNRITRVTAKIAKPYDKSCQLYIVYDPSVAPSPKDRISWRPLGQLETLVSYGGHTGAQGLARCQTPLIIG